MSQLNNKYLASTIFSQTGSFIKKHRTYKTATSLIDVFSISNNNLSDWIKGVKESGSDLDFSIKKLFLVNKRLAKGISNNGYAGMGLGDMGVKLFKIALKDAGIVI